MLQKADVVCHTVTALCHGGKCVQNTAVYFTGIGLTCHIKAFVKAKVCGNHTVHFVYFFRITLKQFHKAGFGSGGATAAEEFDVFDSKINFMKVGKEVLHPECCTFAYRYQLSRLIVSIAKSRHIFVFFGKFRKIR